MKDKFYYIEKICPELKTAEFAARYGVEKSFRYLTATESGHEIWSHKKDNLRWFTYDDAKRFVEFKGDNEVRHFKIRKAHVKEHITDLKKL